MKIFKFPKALRSLDAAANATNSKTTLASRCSAALRKPCRKRVDSANTLETAQCLSDKSLTVFPLEEHTTSTMTSQQEAEFDALSILQRNQVVTLPPLELVVPSTAAVPEVVVSRPARSHRRSLSLSQTDFDDLLFKSRGWRFDPSTTTTTTLRLDDPVMVENTAMPVAPRKNRHDRERNLALSDYDFEKFIFKPTGPRLGHH